MSTKKLSRTVTEGRGSRKEERRILRTETRADERAYLREIQMDVENYYDYDIPQTRSSYGYGSFRWGPVRRWLASHCGQPWSEVRSEAAKVFGSNDKLKTGPYGPYERLLSCVEESPNYSIYGRPDDWTTSYRRHQYYVDEYGILREKRVVQRENSSQFKPIVSCDTEKLAKWLNGRAVGKVGNKYFWFIPTCKNKKRGCGQNLTWITMWGRGYYNYLGFYWLNNKPIYKKDAMGRLILEDDRPIIIGHEPSWVSGKPGAFRQGHKLDSNELNYWNSLPEYYRTKVLEWSPTYDNPVNPEMPRNWYY